MPKIPKAGKSSFKLECFGIDPGRGGAIVNLTEDGTVNHILLKNSLHDISDWILEMSSTVLPGTQVCAVLEKVHAMPGQGVSSMFTFGRSYGECETLLVAHGIPYQETPPERWMKALGVGTKKQHGSKTEWKKHLKAVGQKLYPKIEVTLPMADALLIAHYCKYNFGKSSST